MRRSEAERRAFLTQAASFMECNPTEAERALWTILEPLGFRRQEPYQGVTKNLGNWSYILDFYHWGCRLCVEVDGGVHRKTKGRDRRRDTRLAGEGIVTVRLTNSQVLKAPEEVRFRIQQAMEQLTGGMGG